MLVRDKKTGRFLSKKVSDRITAEKKKGAGGRQGKKSYTLLEMASYGIIVILAIVLFASL